MCHCTQTPICICICIYTHTYMYTFVHLDLMVVPISGDYKNFCLPSSQQAQLLGKYNLFNKTSYSPDFTNLLKRHVL